MSQSVPPKVVMPPSLEQRVLDVFDGNVGRQFSISELFTKVPPNTSMPALLKALARLQQLRRVQMDNVGLYTLVPLSSIPFKDVWPREEYELLGYRGRKLAYPVTEIRGESNVTRGNCFIVEILPEGDEKRFTAGDIARVEDDAVVTVYR